MLWARSKHFLNKTLGKSSPSSYIEDHVETPMVLTRLFNSSGLKEFWFPVTQMPKNGGDWPILQDMAEANQFSGFHFKSRKGGF